MWHNDVFYVHIIIYLKLQQLPATSASCAVRDLSSRVDQSTRCPVRELAYLRVVQLPAVLSIPALYLVFFTLEFFIFQIVI